MAVVDNLRNVSNLKMITRSSSNLAFSSFTIKSSLVSWSQARSINLERLYLLSSRIIL